MQEQKFIGLSGRLVSDTGAPISSVIATITDLASGAEVTVSELVGERFRIPLAPGKYAIAMTSPGGFAWYESVDVPSSDFELRLSSNCERITGVVRGAIAGARVRFSRLSKYDGDRFISSVSSNGTFAACLPHSTYRASVAGASVSLSHEVEVKQSVSGLEFTAYSTAEVSTPATGQLLARSSAEFVADVNAKRVRLVGLGEATHGTGEFVRYREELTFDLIAKAGVQAVFIENESVLVTAIDDFVSGLDVDVYKAVAALGFWITDTEEFVQFLRRLRQYNSTARNKVHVWGIDVQNVSATVKYLLDNALRFRIASDERVALTRFRDSHTVGDVQVTPEEMKRLHSLIARLSTSKGKSASAIRGVIAARALQVQMGFTIKNLDGGNSARRDAGMAGMAQLASDRMGYSEHVSGLIHCTSDASLEHSEITLPRSLAGITQLGSTYTKVRSGRGMRPARSACFPIRFRRPTVICSKVL